MFIVFIQLRVKSSLIFQSVAHSLNKIDTTVVYLIAEGRGLLNGTNSACAMSVWGDGSVKLSKT